MVANALHLFNLISSTSSNDSKALTPLLTKTWPASGQLGMVISAIRRRDVASFHTRIQ